MAAYTRQTIDTAKIFDCPADIFIDDTVDLFLGSTAEDGIKLKSEQTTKDKKVDAVPYAIGKYLDEQKCEITGTIAYGDIATLKTLLGGGITTNTGFGRTSIVEKKFLIKGPGAGATTRTFTIHKGILSVDGDIELKRTASGIPFKIECIGDPSQPEGEQFYTVAEA